MLASAIDGLTAADRESAFAVLVERRLDASYRLATVILGDPHDAEDAVHDAAVAAWRRWSDLRDVDRFDAWFGRILVNACRDRLRSRRRRPVLELDLDGAALHAAIATPDASLPTAHRDALDRAFATLDPDHRIVVALRFYRDLTVDEIAALIGIRPGTVKSRLHHALRRLRAALEAADGRADR
jgi:RNA polymerase sigma-70 factor (ECF subfamily)